MKLTSCARAAALALLLHGSAASAVPLIELRADDLMMMVPELRRALTLNPNQLLLWQRSEARSRALLRERQQRREHLQRQALTLAASAGAELRELGAAVDAESSTSAAEEAQLRALWLTVNDALDDAQRGKVLRFLADQLERVRDSAAPARGEAGPGRDGAGGGPGGGGRRPGGGMGGPGGAGAGAGGGNGGGSGSIGF